MGHIRARSFAMAKTPYRIEKAGSDSSKMKQIPVTFGPQLDTSRSCPISHQLMRTLTEHNNKNEACHTVPDEGPKAAAPQGYFFNENRMVGEEGLEPSKS